MNVDIIASGISDNFFYALTDATDALIWVDPIDGAQAVKWAAERGMRVRAVLNTHFHHDHIGGNDAVFEAFPDAELWAGAGDSEQIEAQQVREVDRRLNGGDHIRVGDTALEILATPGHTPGHISVLGGGHLFSGDTIFAGGVGNCSFGGDAGVLYTTFRDVISVLDDAVVFYPGHDYLVRNLEFIVATEPENGRAKKMLGQLREEADESAPKGASRTLHLRTLGEERAYNPFFRVEDEGLIQLLESEHAEVFSEAMAVSGSRPEAAFRALRELRNRW